MRRVTIWFILIVRILALLFFWKRAFLSLVILDVIGFRIIIAFNIRLSLTFILFLVLQVYSSALGFIILIRETRGVGRDKVIQLF